MAITTTHGDAPFVPASDAASYDKVQLVCAHCQTVVASATNAFVQASTKFAYLFQSDKAVLGLVESDTLCQASQTSPALRECILQQPYCPGGCKRKKTAFRVQEAPADGQFLKGVILWNLQRMELRLQGAVTAPKIVATLPTQAATAPGDTPFIPVRATSSARLSPTETQTSPVPATLTGGSLLSGPDATQRNAAETTSKASQHVERAPSPTAQAHWPAADTSVARGLANGALSWLEAHEIWTNMTSSMVSPDAFAKRIRALGVVSSQVKRGSAWPPAERAWTAQQETAQQETAQQETAQQEVTQQETTPVSAVASESAKTIAHTEPLAVAPAAPVTPVAPVALSLRTPQAQEARPAQLPKPDTTAALQRAKALVAEWTEAALLQPPRSQSSSHPPAQPQSQSLPLHSPLQADQHTQPQSNANAELPSHPRLATDANPETGTKSSTIAEDVARVISSPRKESSTATVPVRKPDTEVDPGAATILADMQLENPVAASQQVADAVRRLVAASSGRAEEAVRATQRRSDQSTTAPPSAVSLLPDEEALVEEKEAQPPQAEANVLGIAMPTRKVSFVDMAGSESPSTFASLSHSPALSNRIQPTPPLNSAQRFQEVTPALTGPTLSHTQSAPPGNFSGHGRLDSRPSVGEIPHRVLPSNGSAQQWVRKVCGDSAAQSPQQTPQIPTTAARIEPSRTSSLSKVTSYDPHARDKPTGNTPAASLASRQAAVSGPASASRPTPTLANRSTGPNRNYMLQQDLASLSATVGASQHPAHSHNRHSVVSTKPLPQHGSTTTGNTVEPGNAKHIGVAPQRNPGSFLESQRRNSSQQHQAQQLPAAAAVGSPSEGSLNSNMLHSLILRQNQNINQLMGQVESLTRAHNSLVTVNNHLQSALQEMSTKAADGFTRAYSVSVQASERWQKLEQSSAELRHRIQTQLATHDVGQRVLETCIDGLAERLSHVEQQQKNDNDRYGQRIYDEHRFDQQYRQYQQQQQQHRLDELEHDQPSRLAPETDVGLPSKHDPGEPDTNAPPNSTAKQNVSVAEEARPQQPLSAVENLQENHSEPHSDEAWIEPLEHDTSNTPQLSKAPSPQDSKVIPNARMKESQPKVVQQQNATSAVKLPSRQTPLERMEAALLADVPLQRSSAELAATSPLIDDSSRQLPAHLVTTKAPSAVGAEPAETNATTAKVFEANDAGVRKRTASVGLNGALKRQKPSHSDSSRPNPLQEVLQVRDLSQLDDLARRMATRNGEWFQGKDENDEPELLPPVSHHFSPPKFIDSPSARGQILRRGVSSGALRHQSRQQRRKPIRAEDGSLIRLDGGIDRRSAARRASIQSVESAKISPSIAAKASPISKPGDRGRRRDANGMLLRANGTIDRRSITSRETVLKLQKKRMENLGSRNQESGAFPSLRRLSTPQVQLPSPLASEIIGNSDSDSDGVELAVDAVGMEGDTDQRHSRVLGLMWPKGIATVRDRVDYAFREFGAPSVNASPSAADATLQPRMSLPEAASLARNTLSPKASATDRPTWSALVDKAKRNAGFDESQTEMSSPVSPLALRRGPSLA